MGKWEVLIYLCSMCAIYLNLQLFKHRTLEISISKHTTQPDWPPLAWFHVANYLAPRNSMQQPPNETVSEEGAVQDGTHTSSSHNLIVFSHWFGKGKKKKKKKNTCQWLQFEDFLLSKRVLTQDQKSLWQRVDSAN